VGLLQALLHHAVLPVHHVSMQCAVRYISFAEYTKDIEEKNEQNNSQAALFHMLLVKKIYHAT
jgi:hypothetical protein